MPPPTDSRLPCTSRLPRSERIFLRNTGLSAVCTETGGTRVGTGTFNTDNVFGSDGKITLPTDAGFGTILSDLGTKNLLALLDLEEQSGRAKTLAEPNIIAGNKDTATFLAGGEIPVPVLQPGANGTNNTLTIQYKEFGVRLKFSGEILNDSLIKLYVRPEVSSLDFTNGVVISGFRIPAFRTRRVETTIDVRRDQSMIISGSVQQRPGTDPPWNSIPEGHSDNRRAVLEQIVDEQRKRACGHRHADSDRSDGSASTGCAPPAA